MTTPVPDIADIPQDLGDALSSQRRSARLRPEPVPVSALRVAATIAGALRDPRGLSIIGLIVALAIFAAGAIG